VRRTAAVTSVEGWRDLRGDGAVGSLARGLGRIFTGASVEERVRRNEEGMRITLERLADELE
jgi:hypothetical protein